MTTSPARPIRKFNPGLLQSDTELIEQFVVRQGELDIVLEVLRGNIDSPSCQHALLVAPRGQGKTMLLARVAAELRTDENLSAHLFAVQFMEESLEVFTLADFWLETLFHLAKETESSYPELSRELHLTRDDLTGRYNEARLEDQAFAAVMDAADRLNKQLVLMVENLQALSQSVDEDFGWKLRKVLQCEPQIILLGTATSRFAALDDITQPFFEFFHIVSLEPLGTMACQRLWEMVSGQSVAKREIRPLEILTGGNPRLLVIVAAFAGHRSFHQLMEDLVTLIDEYTEYFRGHLDVLAKTERRVYLAVIDLWQPSTTAEVAARARMDIRTVSTMLGRLRERRAIGIEDSGPKRLYAASERLYCIYYKLRRERDQAGLVRLLLQFMTAFYAPRETAGLLHEFWQETGVTPGEHAWLAEAVAESAQHDEALDHHLGVARDLISKSVLHELDDRPMVALGIFDDLVARFGASNEPKLQQMVIVALYLKGITLRNELGNPEAALDAFEDVLNHLDTSEDNDLGMVAQALLMKASTHLELGQFSESRSFYERVLDVYGANNSHEFQDEEESDSQYREVQALFGKGVTCIKLGQSVSAIQCFETLADRFDSSEDSTIRLNVASALRLKSIEHLKVGQADDTVYTCDELKARFGALEDHDRIPFWWHADWMRVKALTAQGRFAVVLDLLQSLVIGNVLDNKAMLEALLAHVLDLIAQGAASGDVARILSSNPQVAAALQPLVVALRQLAGEAVRAPAEVMEVAVDIRNVIESRAETVAAV